MQFVKLEVSYNELMATIRAIPGTWWRAPMGQMQSLFSFLHSANVDMDVLARYSTQISQEITDAKTLVNCTISEERIVTFNIPIRVTDFYQVRVQPGEPKRFTLQMFYPSEHDSVTWYGKLASAMTYEMGKGHDRVVIDGETVTIKAWNAICALAVAQGVAGSADGILMDMARDGEI